jgi:hypothetical protein
MTQIFILYDRTDGEVPIGFFTTLEAATNAINEQCYRHNGKPPCYLDNDYEETLLEIFSCQIGEINPEITTVSARRWVAWEDVDHQERWLEVKN